MTTARDEEREQCPWPQDPRAVASKLGNYVCLYVNPLNRVVFYVGKGKGSRALAHLDTAEERAIARVIREIGRPGRSRRDSCVVHSAA